VARPKKNREISIVHFSFFDLLFGAFGAFVFLMIMQVLSTLNLVDVDIQKLVDETVQEKVTLRKELEQYEETDRVLHDLQQKYERVFEDRKQLVQEKERLSDKTSKLEVKVSSLQRELDSLIKFKETVEKRGDAIKALEDENKGLRKSLEKVQRRLAGTKTTPLKIKTRSFPTTITGEQIHLALAAEGGSAPYTWEVEGRLPIGVSFDKMMGTISGVVKTDGNYTFKVKVTDAKGLSVKNHKDISLNVIKRYEEQKKKVSPWFVVMTIISSLLLVYIMWGKYRAHKAYREMVRKGFKPVWVRE
jgi:predicted ribosome quality control (RQC) complex YloA/Tae2 family protein